MITENEKLERFEKAVDDDVDKQIQEILQQAESSRNEILKKANDVSLSEANDKLNEEMKNITGKYIKLVSKAELDCKREVLVHREKIANQVIENVRKSLISFVQTEEYKTYLIKLIKDEIESSDNASQMIFYLSKNDMKLSDEIKKAIGKEICLQDRESIKIGGVCIGFKNNNVMMEKTLDSELAEQTKEFNNSSCLRLN